MGEGEFNHGGPERASRGWTGSQRGPQTRTHLRSHLPHHPTQLPRETHFALGATPLHREPAQPQKGRLLWSQAPGSLESSPTKPQAAESHSGLTPNPAVTSTSNLSPCGSSKFTATMLPLLCLHTQSHLCAWQQTNCLHLSPSQPYFSLTNTRAHTDTHPTFTCSPASYFPNPSCFGKQQAPLGAVLVKCIWPG